jgi:hypothetical protein
MFENKYIKWWGDVKIIEIRRDKRWKLTTAEADSISYLIQVSVLVTPWCLLAILPESLYIILLRCSHIVVLPNRL